MSIPQPRPSPLPLAPPNLLASPRVDLRPSKNDANLPFPSVSPNEGSGTISASLQTARPIPILKPIATTTSTAATIAPDHAAQARAIQTAIPPPGQIASTIQIPSLALPQPLLSSPSLNLIAGSGGKKIEPVGGLAIGGHEGGWNGFGGGSYAPNSLKDLKGQSVGLGGAIVPLPGFDFTSHTNIRPPSVNRPDNEHMSRDDHSSASSGENTVRPFPRSEDGGNRGSTGSRTIRAGPIGIPLMAEQRRERQIKVDETLPNVISPHNRLLRHEIDLIPHIDNSFQAKINAIEQELKMQKTPSQSLMATVKRLSPPPQGEARLGEGEGAGVGARGEIDEVDVEWCFFCGREGERDRMDLKEVKWKRVEEGDDYGMETSTACPEGEEDAGWQWVCKGGCGAAEGHTERSREREEISLTGTDCAFESSEGKGW
ncbi:hypothetical protein CI109_104500 [Kwoniella shandongensis]|uniref:Uncharacterized protein n=1 Tax=Kwoniella shandongensis TaxID=1734106 RepID=A0A5M6BV35_9TREE|nr:uncharacterized protein CI109_006799 [Kwoniella shandongensis]KAA5524849.1 hypothetical protein CI109_006799 [Kwoniella shandongensis]